MRKVLIGIMVLALLSTMSMAQERFTNTFKLIGHIEQEDVMNVMGAGDKGLFFITEQCAFNADTGAYLAGLIKLTANKHVGFSFFVASIAAQKVQLHYTYTGPTFAQNQSDVIGLVRGDMGEIGFVTESRFFKKGLYTLTVIAKSSKSQSGAGLTSVYKFYCY